ncbi:hypothetical protein BLOT_015931 [Blomia tropicalis]|nr:hypothetical protein BLOT_015931 [Blomia tropicalis]
MGRKRLIHFRCKVQMPICSTEHLKRIQTIGTNVRDGCLSTTSGISSREEMLSKNSIKTNETNLKKIESFISKKASNNGYINVENNFFVFTYQPIQTYRTKCSILGDLFVCGRLLSPISTMRTKKWFLQSTPIYCSTSVENDPKLFPHSSSYNLDLEFEGNE